ncbi:MAG: YqgE/AlgH family protein [Gammaproteobacteria bacterium]
MGYTQNLRDNLLIAMPSMADPNFFRSVTYLCDHNTEGAMGIMINRPLDISLSDIALQIGHSPESVNSFCEGIPIYDGGPVSNDRGYILHTPYGEWQSTLKVSNTVSLTTSQDILDAIINGDTPDKFIIALGYAGWGEGQLEHEIAENAWLSGPSNNTILFDSPVTERWSSSAHLLGFDMINLSNDIGHA